MPWIDLARLSPRGIYGPVGTPQTPRSSGSGVIVSFAVKTDVIKWTWWIVVLGSACSSAEPQSTPDAGSGPTVNAGRALFEQRIPRGNSFTCDTCHALQEPAADLMRRPGHQLDQDRVLASQLPAAAGRFYRQRRAPDRETLRFAVSQCCNTRLDAAG